MPKICVFLFDEDTFRILDWLILLTFEQKTSSGNSFGLLSMTGVSAKGGLMFTICRCCYKSKYADVIYTNESINEEFSQTSENIGFQNLKKYF